MKFVDTDAEWIQTRTGISQRHILGKGESLTMLGAAAATKVLLRSRWVTPQSSLGDAGSSLGDAKSSLGDAESSLVDAKSSLGDAKSSLVDAKSSLVDAESSLGEC
jgi:hypothetical protein